MMPYFSTGFYHLLAFTVLTYLYYPALSQCYIHGDDVTHFYHAKLLVSNDFHVAEGRPLYGVYLKQFMQKMSSLCDLSLMRYSGFGLLLLFYAALCRLLKSLNWPDFMVSGCALVCCILPSVALYVIWASTTHILIAALLAMVAAYLLYSAQYRCYTLVLALLCLLIALMLYQPAVMFVIVYLAIQWLQLRTPLDKSSLTPYIRTMLGLVSAIMLYFIWYWFQWYPFTLSDSVTAEIVAQHRTRMDLGFDWVAKLHWFIKGALVDSGLQHFIMVEQEWHPLILGGFLCVVIAGIYSYLRGVKVTHTLLWVLGLIVLLLATYSPNLLVIESRLNFRTQGALAVLLTIILCFAIAQIPNKWFKAVCMLLWVGASIGMSKGYIHQYFVAVKSYEYQQLSQLIEKLALPADAEVGVIAADWNAPPLGRHYHEYGYFTSATSWYPTFLQILHAETQGRYNTPLVIHPLVETSRLPSYPIISLKEILSDCCILLDVD